MDERTARAPGADAQGSAEARVTSDHLPDWAQERLPLDRPLAVIDLETTGTAPYRDRIVEIAVVKIWPDGRKETHHRRINPGVPISPESTAVHGIRDADVKGEPEFRRVASHLVDYLQGCDLAGFGIAMFDLPMLRAEFERAGVPFPVAGRRIIDAKTIYHAKEPRTLSAAHDLYCGARFTGAHSAEADAQATYRVLLGQLRHYPDLPHSMEALHIFCNPREADYVDTDGKLVWLRDEVCFNFGKHRGEPLREVCVTDPEYVRWVASGEAPAELRRILGDALRGRLPHRPGGPSRPGVEASAAAARPASAPEAIREHPSGVQHSTLGSPRDRSRPSGWRRLCDRIAAWRSRRLGDGR